MRSRSERLPIRACVAIMNLIGLASQVQAAPLILPIEPSMLPLVVAGAFIFPGLMAAVFGGFFRLARVRPILGFGVLAVAALALAGYLNPALLASLRV